MPVDGVVLDGSSHVDEALLSGESLPLRKQAGDRVIGGSVNGSGALLIEVRDAGSATLLGQIVRQVAQAHRPRAQAPPLEHRRASGRASGSQDVFIPRGP